MVKTKENIIGKKFNKLTVLEQIEDYIEPNGKKQSYYLCQCECGNTTKARGKDLKREYKKSCGCLSKRKSEYEYNDIIGKQFELLKVLKRIEDKSLPNGQRQVQYLCECQCGNKTIASRGQLFNKQKKSCGCLKEEKKQKYRLQLLEEYKNKKIGSLTIVDLASDYIRQNGRKEIAFKTICDCGNTKIVRKKDLLSDKIKSCGCQRGRKDDEYYNDLIGSTFGNLQVLKRIEDKTLLNNQREIWYLCKCKCGNTIKVRRGNLMNGQLSCGCLNGFTPNHYEFKENYVIEYTAQGDRFYIDIEDYEKVNQIKWSSHLKRGGTYIDSKNNQGKHIELHRFITNNPKGKYIDHLNHCTRDNRKINLRICSASENLQNRIIDKRNTSGVTGVRLTKNNTWCATICYQNKQIRLGTFKTKEEAIEIRKQAEKKYFSNFTIPDLPFEELEELK